MSKVFLSIINRQEFKLPLSKESLNSDGLTIATISTK
jgi:hypothetical protein